MTKLPKKSEHSSESRIHNELENVRQSLKILMREHKINSAKLSKACNMSQQTIHRILFKPEYTPNYGTLSELANYFNISVEQLLGQCFTTTTEKTPTSISRRIPVIPWQKAHDAQAFIQQLTPQNSEQAWISLDSNAPREHIIYALKNENRQFPGFDNCSLLIIDRDLSPTNDDIVFVGFKNAIMFRKMTIDGHYKTLNSIACDAAPPEVLTPSYKILGVVIERRLFHY